MIGFYLFDLICVFRGMMMLFFVVILLFGVLFVGYLLIVSVVE